MADADHTEPWARLDGQGLTPECPQEALGRLDRQEPPHPGVHRKPWGPAGQAGAPHTRVSRSLLSSGAACEARSVRVSSVAVSVAQGLRGGPGLSL